MISSVVDNDRPHLVGQPEVILQKEWLGLMFG